MNALEANKVVLFLAAPVVFGLVTASAPAEGLPGVVINYSPASSGRYIGCPAIAILPDGDYVATHTFFGPKATCRRTLVFGSADRGLSWSKRGEIEGQFWSTLFVHRDALYLMGPDGKWGNVVIRRSDNGGRTWTEPEDKQSGLLLDDGRYHSSTVPVVEHAGRLWRAVEGEDAYPRRGRDVHPYCAFVMSAPVDADLLRAESWTRTNYQKFDLSRVGKRPGDRSGGWREGNVVVSPKGQLINFLRIDDAGVDRADLLPVSADGRRIEIDDENWGLIDFPGGRTKFTIRFDPRSQRYWSLVNKQADPVAERNVLALVSSADLKRWKVNTIVLRHRDARHHAWQYVDWRFDGDDLVAVSRTGWDDSHNFHDANYLTFHRVKRFRELTMADAAGWLPESDGARTRGVVRPLAQEHVVVYESPDAKRLFCYSPGLARLESGRLVATIDLGGPAAKDLPGPKFNRRVGYGRWWQGKVFTSDDGGRTWTHRADYPMMHARPFVAGDCLYVLGQADDIAIIRSCDGGVTFSEPSRLTEDQWWTQAPSNVLFANGCVYLSMRYTGNRKTGNRDPRGAASVLLRGKVDADLTRPDSWTFATRLTAAEAIEGLGLDGFGVPFYQPNTQLAPGRRMGALHWSESQVVQFVDPDHLWFDPRGRTFHLWARADTGGTGYAALLKVVEHDDGRMVTQLQRAPSGKRMLFVPCPGGQMKFHVIYDQPSKRYWLLSTQATDSMTRPDRLPSDRYHLPNNERRRLQLHFSKNMIDWCFAGLVAVGPAEHASRHYASMVVDGDDLLVLSRSGDERARSAHDGNLITLHRVRAFRDLCDFGSY